MALPKSRNHSTDTGREAGRPVRSVCSVIDETDAGLHAVRWAARLARQCRVSLTVVFQSRTPALAYLGVPPHMLAQLSAELAEQTRRTVVRLAADSNVPLSFLAVPSGAASVARTMASAGEIDLIVSAHHGPLVGIAGRLNAMLRRTSLDQYTIFAGVPMIRLCKADRPDEASYLARTAQLIDEIADSMFLSALDESAPSPETGEY